MKSSNVEFTPEVAACFVEGFLATKCSIGFVLIDTGHQESMATMDALALAANRSGSHRRSLSRDHLSYTFFAPRSVLEALHAMADLSGEIPSFFDVVFDSKSLPSCQETAIRRALTVPAERLSIEVRRLSWRTEGDEPLLLVPDILAGVIHRSATKGDCAQACEVLVREMKKGRIRMLDGLALKREPITVDDQDCRE